MNYTEIIITLKNEDVSLVALKKINSARDWASVLHANKTYNGKSYVTGHLDEIASIFVDYYPVDMSMNDNNDFISVADCLCTVYLHDVMEDCGVSYNEIKKQFGITVAELVFAVTNGDGRNRKERAAPTYIKMQKLPKSIYFKLGDRIVNMRNGSKSLIDMYVNEFEEFKKKLYGRNVDNSMWLILQGIINNIKPTKPVNPEEGD